MSTTPPGTSKNLKPHERIILSARWVVGQLGFVAATAGYYQVTLSDEAEASTVNNPQIRLAIVAHSALFSENLGTQLWSIMDEDKRSLSLPNVVRGWETYSDQVHGYAVSRNSSLSREQFDRSFKAIQDAICELREEPSFQNIRKFRHHGVAHLTLKEYRTSSADFFEMSHRLFGIGKRLQSVFKSGVDERDLIALYREHLSAASSLYGLEKPLDPIFWTGAITFHTAVHDS